jgi:hypothetical protein
VFAAAAVALHAQESVLQQTALQIVFELLADDPRQVTAGAFDLLHEPRGVLGNDAIERGLLRSMPAAGRCHGDAESGEKGARIRHDLDTLPM